LAAASHLQLKRLVFLYFDGEGGDLDDDVRRHLVQNYNDNNGLFQFPFSTCRVPPPLKFWVLKGHDCVTINHLDWVCEKYGLVFHRVWHNEVEDEEDNNVDEERNGEDTAAAAAATNSL
jgi:hypothetical protein